MKLQRLALSMVAIAIFMSFTFKDGKYKIDSQKSKLVWTGKKVTGQHTGTINISEGEFITASNKVTGGSFVIDMTSIKDSEANERLEGHLRSDDFFSTEKNTKATFAITRITFSSDDKYTVKGNLTLKGITNEIEFPASIQFTNDQIVAKALILVDRTKFDIKFRSGNFFENLGDKVIDDNFELNVELIGSGAI